MGIHSLDLIWSHLCFFFFEVVDIILPFIRSRHRLFFRLWLPFAFLSKNFFLLEFIIAHPPSRDLYAQRTLQDDVETLSRALRDDMTIVPSHPSSTAKCKVRISVWSTASSSAKKRIPSRFVSLSSYATIPLLKIIHLTQAVKSAKATSTLKTREKKRESRHDRQKVEVTAFRIGGCSPTVSFFLLFPSFLLSKGSYLLSFFFLSVAILCERLMVAFTHRKRKEEYVGFNWTHN